MAKMNDIATEGTTPGVRTKHTGYTVSDVIDFLWQIAPPERKMDFDNVGLLVGSAGVMVSRILVSLDITDEVIGEAEELGAELIVSHHPLFFSLKTVTDGEPEGRKILRLARNSISAICMHTNLDAADGGVNDALAAVLGLCNPRFAVPEGTDRSGRPYSCLRYGELERETDFSEYLTAVKKALNANGLRFVSSGSKVRRVAVLGGSGGSYLKAAVEAGCDTLLTADVKYSVFLEAKEAGVNLIDGDHFCTENVIVPVLAGKLRERFEGTNVYVSDKHRQTAQFF